MRRKRSSDTAGSCMAMPDPNKEGADMATTAPQPGDGRQVQVSFRIPADHADALERVAALEDRTVSAELRRIIRRHLQAEDQLPIPEAA